MLNRFWTWVLLIAIGLLVSVSFKSGHPNKISVINTEAAAEPEVTLPLGLRFFEGFELTPWEPSESCSYGGCCFGRGCFKVLGCGTSSPLMIRNFSANGKCANTRSRKVKTWTGSGTLFHGQGYNTGAWAVAQMPPYLSGQVPANISEILTSREKQVNDSGRLRVDFQVHGPDVTSIDNEHYIIAHHLNIQPNTNCRAACDGEPGTYFVRNNGAEVFEFYGVIAGNFGSPSLAGVEGCEDPDGYKCRGFVVEVRTKEGVILPASTFIPFTEDGKFPANRWYRVIISWDQDTHVYQYTVKQWLNSKWELIGIRIIDDHVFFEGGRPPLRRGYIGLSAIWTEPTRGSDVVHLDWDNISVNW